MAARPPAGALLRGRRAAARAVAAAYRRRGALRADETRPAARAGPRRGLARVPARSSAGSSAELRHRTPCAATSRTAARSAGSSASSGRAREPQSADWNLDAGAPLAHASFASRDVRLRSDERRELGRGQGGSTSATGRAASTAGPRSTCECGRGRAHRALPARSHRRISTEPLTRVASDSRRPSRSAGHGIAARRHGQSMTVDGSAGAAATDERPSRADYMRRCASSRRPPRSRCSRRRICTTTSPIPCDVEDLLAALLDASADARDRLVLVDIPAPNVAASSAVGWIDALRSPHDPTRRRSAAAYHPALRVPDPLGGAANPVRTLPASGHVAGVISRLDRERGAHYTPANAPLLRRGRRRAACSTSRSSGAERRRRQPRCAAPPEAGSRCGELERSTSITYGPLRCAPPADPSAGARDPPRRRAARVRDQRAGVPADARARRSPACCSRPSARGALKGARPEEGFRVRCDESNNPPEEQDVGRVVCEIEIAPAVPDGVHHAAHRARRRGAPGGLRSTMHRGPAPAFRFLVTLDPADAYLPPVQAALLTVVAAGQFQEAQGARRRSRGDAVRRGRRERLRAPAPGAPLVDAHHAQARARSRSRAVVLVHGRAHAVARRAPRRRDHPAHARRRCRPSPGFRAGIAAKWTGPELNAARTRSRSSRSRSRTKGSTQVPLAPPGWADACHDPAASSALRRRGRRRGAAFARLFEKYIAPVRAACDEARSSRRGAPSDDRALGDRAERGRGA